MKIKDKGKHIICGQSPVGQGLPERTGLLKKGYRQVVDLAACKDKTANIGSSSERDGSPASLAWYVGFYGGYVDDNYKRYGLNVRSFFAF